MFKLVITNVHAIFHYSVFRCPFSGPVRSFIAFLLLNRAKKSQVNSMKSSVACLSTTSARSSNQYKVFKFVGLNILLSFARFFGNFEFFDMAEN